MDWGDVNGSSEDTERTFYFLDNLLHLNAPWQILNPSDHPKQWEGVFNILSRPWYSRAWIIQEIASCKTVRIFCGQGETNIHSIKALLNLLGKRWVDSMTFLGEQTDVMKRNMDNMKKLFAVRDIHQRGENGRLSLVRTLNQMRHFQATDGRDKVYALLWLFKVTTPSLKPNYRKTVEEVYIEYARQMFIKGHGLITMIVAGRHQTQLLKLPSWCPDWSQRPTLRSFTLENAERIGMAKHDPDNSIKKIEDLQGYGYETMIRTFAASGESLETARLGEDTSQVIIKGLLVDKIVCVGGESLERAGTMHKWWKAWSTASFEQMDASSNRYSADTDSRVDALFRLVTADNALGMLKDPAVMRHFEAALQAGSTHVQDFGVTQEFLRNIRLVQHHPEITHHFKNAPSEFEYTQVLLTALCFVVPILLQGRRFCVTEKGFIALVPDISKVGDHICIVLGLSAPFIVRNVDEKVNELVGDAFVLDMMQREALKMDDVAEQDIVLV